MLYARTIRMLAAWITVVGVLLHTVQAKPQFNSVNKYDADGNRCPLRDRSGELCPQLCVSDVSLCPKGFGDDSCPSGQKLCIDGSCSSDCGDIPERKNPCGCTFQYPPAEAKGLVPCAAFSSVTIERFNADDSSQIIDFCSEKFNISGTVPTWGKWADEQELPDGIISGERYWAGTECPEVPDYHYTYDEPLWIGVFSCVGAEVLILVVWLIYKFIREMPIRRLRHNESGFTATAAVAVNSDSGSDSKVPINADEKASKESTGSTDGEDEPDLFIRGFKNDILGWIGFVSVLLVSLGWFVWLGFWVGDYYGTLGEPNSLAHYNSTLLEVTMIPIWIFAITWLVVCCTFQDRLRNFFRIECLPSDASYVQIDRELKTLTMASSNSRFVKFAKSVEEHFTKFIKANYRVETCKIETTKTSLRYFNYMCTRYVLNETTKQYGPYQFDMGTTHRQLLQKGEGLTSEEAASRFELVGPNFISVYVPNFFVAFCLEMSQFFYLYQFMVMWLYYYWNYYVIGVIDTAIILVSAIVKVVVRVLSELRVKRMAEQREECHILRDGKWVELSTIDLVPGDVFKVNVGLNVPCDAVILGGNIVVDESSLTGEPLPIRKFPINADDGIHDQSGAGKINTLFSGTSVSQAQTVNSSDGSVSEPIALCLHTGTQTDKGQLIQQILFPQPISFIFNEQLRLVFGILIVYAIIVFVLAMVFYQTKPSASWFYAMFSCSQLISPLLPAALVMGQSVASGRLKKKQIYCVDLPRIVMAGKVQMFCFDKTGTLTKEGLEFYGGLCSHKTESNGIENHTFMPFIDKFDALPDAMKTAATTCHAVAEVDGGLMIGNPVDIEMFRTTKWSISKTPNPGALDTVTSPSGDLHLDIIKRFEFIHSRASMSVAVRDPRDGHVHVFVKGSFEKVKEHLDPKTVPSNFLASANKMAREGGYVLAVGHRDLGDIDVNDMQDWTRDDMENGAELVGFIVFKNMLKEDTAEAIGKLKSGDTRTIMITGDTALTGVFIARSAGLMNEGATIYLGDVDKGGEISWIDVDKDEPVPQSYVDDIITGTANGDYELAMTGKAFNHLIDQGLIRQYLLFTRVFARMLPNDKVNCVQLHMERGITAMCGDGGNDCGALRAAHVGVALSDAEASIVSPFSSSDRSINACVELLIQGRSALATSFAGYQYLILYGQTMTFLKIFSFYFSNTASSNTWIWVDAFINTLMSICVAYSRPAKTLSKYRPTARILGPQVMTSACGVVAINFTFLACSFSWLYSKNWFRCNEFDSSTTDVSKWWLLADNYEAEVLAIVSLYQFVNNAMVVNFGYLYRARWYRNYALVFLWAGYFAMISVVLLARTNWLGCRFRMNCGSKDVLAKEYNLHPKFHIEDYNNIIGHNIIPKNDRYELWGICMGNMAATIIWQLIFALYPVHTWTRNKRPLRRLKIKL